MQHLEAAIREIELRSAEQEISPTSAAEISEKLHSASRTLTNLELRLKMEPNG